jgi:enediyne polyketide synthase
LGVTLRYVRADVSDANAVEQGLQEVQRALGPITAVLHGAGANEPKLLRDLDVTACRATVAPKVYGLEQLLAALDANRLRWLVAFGSIIARTGFRGEADYALANGWLTERTERFARANPACRCLVLEWSIWSGVGMGERLGRVEALSRQGIRAISPDAGVAILRDLLGADVVSVSVVVSARFGEKPLLPVVGATRDDHLPLWRFLERPRVHYPGLELVTDASLSVAADPYLLDHTLEGVPVLPGVLSLEAIAQAAMAVTGAESPPRFSAVAFARAITVPAHEDRTLRIAALVGDSGEVDVVVRSSETAFSVDHVRARCHFAREAARAPSRATSTNGTKPTSNGHVPQARLSLRPDPERELYGGILFQLGRFKRLHSYESLSALVCSAVIAPDGDTPWFGRFHSPWVVLGDPGVRDAGLHAIQACVPHRRVLPVAVEAIRIEAGGAPTRVEARETRREAGAYVFDLDFADADGTVVEAWRGLRLAVIGEVSAREFATTSLLAPFIERSLHEILPDAGITIGVTRDAPSSRSTDLLSEIGVAPPIGRRADGKLETDGSRSVSASHGAKLLLVAAGSGSVACDVEPVADRSSETWMKLLGPDGMELVRVVAREAGEHEAVSATRVWTAMECLKKAGFGAAAPVLDRIERQGWVVFRCGPVCVGSVMVEPTDLGERIVVSVLGSTEAATRLPELEARANLRSSTPS